MRKPVFGYVRPGYSILDIIAVRIILHVTREWITKMLIRLRMHRMICIFIVRIWHKCVLSWWSSIFGVGFNNILLLHWYSKEEKTQHAWLLYHFKYHIYQGTIFQTLCFFLSIWMLAFLHTLYTCKEIQYTLKIRKIRTPPKMLKSS